MTRLPLTIAALSIHFVLMIASAHADESGPDKGKEVVGKVKATLYIGTDAEPSTLGGKLAFVEAATVKRLSSIQQMKFNHYRKLGADIQPVFRSYENWLTPLKPSEEILLSFESRGSSAKGGLRLDLEFWQHRRKVMKSDPVLHLGKPLFILGPKWRGGTMIIAIELVENSLKK